MDKLIEALKLIKDECQKYDNCDECPMWEIRLEKCGLHCSPRAWKVNETVQFRPSVIGGN